MMRSLKWIVLLMLTFSTLWTATGCSKTTNGTSKPTVLRMGLIPAEDSAEMMNKYKPLQQYLEKELNVKIEMSVATDYTGVVEAMRSKKLDFAWFGPLTYLLAEKEAGAEPLVVENQAATGTGYHSLIIARKDSGLKSIEDLKGKTYAFVDPGSTSGYLIPSAMYKKSNIDPKQYFKDLKFAGGHDAVAMAVKNKQVDAGSMDDVTFNKMVKGGILNKDDYTIIWTSDIIPGSPIACRSDLDPDLKNRLKQALISVGDKDPKSIGGLGSVTKYVETNKDFYNPVREAATLMNIDLAKKK